MAEAFPPNIRRVGLVKYVPNSGMDGPIREDGSRILKLRTPPKHDLDQPKPTSKKAKKRAKQKQKQMEAKAKNQPPKADDSDEELIAFPLCFESMAIDDKYRIMTFYHCLLMDDMNLFRVLLEEFVCEASVGYHLLRAAARRNNLQAVKVLLEYGCPVNRSARFSYSALSSPSPLHYARKFRNNKMARLLIAKGADQRDILERSRESFENDYDDFFEYIEKNGAPHFL